jgi:hypothetical protein
MYSRYSKVWDEKFNELLNTYNFVLVDKYTAKIGEWEVWITTYPYASFTLYNPRVLCRPSRFTIKKAWAKLHKDTNIGNDEESIKNIIKQHEAK